VRSAVLMTTAVNGLSSAAQGLHTIEDVLQSARRRDADQTGENATGRRQTKSFGPGQLTRYDPMRNRYQGQGGQRRHRERTFLERRSSVGIAPMVTPVGGDRLTIMEVEGFADRHCQAVPHDKDGLRCSHISG
jgi:hypothetical protein